MNGPEKVPWRKKALIEIPLALIVMIGGFGAWIIPPDNGCPPRKSAQTESFFVQGPTNIE